MILTIMITKTYDILKIVLFKECIGINIKK